MKQYTDVTVLVDRSGSMDSIKDAMESAYAEFLMMHRKVPSTRITLVQFDSENAQEVIYTAVPVADADRLDVVPRGGTPLLYALCTAIDNTGKRLAAMSEADRPDQVLFVIITDGQENMARGFTRADVKQRVDTQGGIYKWQFVYLGANQDAFEEAASFGIGAANTMHYAASSSGVKGMSAGLARSTVSYTSRTTPGPDVFTKEERDNASK